MESPGKKLPLINAPNDTDFLLKSDDLKNSKNDLIKGEIVKNYNVRKDLEEGDSGLQGSDIIGITDEICGSTSSYSDTRTIVPNESSCDEINLDSSMEDGENVSGKNIFITYHYYYYIFELVDGKCTNRHDIRIDYRDIYYFIFFFQVRNAKR